MNRTKRSGSFMMCLLFNILLNFEGFIPAAVLLVLHFALKLPIWWSAAAAAVWIGWIILWMLVINWASRCGSMPAPKNKNPYSAQNKKQAETESIKTKSR